ncbi:LAMI_0D11892g1_1 [Lachancea mirantina]|uniref:LAMI_0D11892g1_1 n=1 Tax=Lachancea mirantina TaxID=1230905 RepID=A0A1G4JFB7_9SACH|nr:LAMI_0D11892g1_1 [Lachancea mirantina]
MPVIRHESEEFNLAHDEEEKLNHFQLITGFPEDDLPQIIQLLRNHGWQLEPALSRYFDGDWRENLSGSGPALPPRPPTPMEPRLSETPLNSSSPFIINQANFIPSLPLARMLPLNYKEKFLNAGLDRPNSPFASHPAIIVLLVLPRILLKAGMGLLSLLWSIISFGFRTDGVQSETVAKLPSRPLTVSESLRTQISSKYQDSDELCNLISKEPYNDIYKKCEQEYKYLLLICMGDISSEDPTAIDINSERLTRHILNDSSTISLLKNLSDNVKIYARSAHDSEMWCVAKQLNIRQTPECLLIGNVLNSAGSTFSTTRMSVLGRLRIGNLQKFQNSLKLCLEKYDSEMVVNRTEREQLNTARLLKQMQDEAYENSLKQDQIKQKNRELAEKETALAEEKALQRLELIRLQRIIRSLKAVCLCLDLLCGEVEEEAGEKLASIQVRTSNGTRFILKLSKNDTLQKLYHVTYAHLWLQEFAPQNRFSILTKLKQKLLDLQEEVDDIDFQDALDDTGEHDEQQIRELALEQLEKLEKLAPDTDIELDFELVCPFPRSVISNDLNEVIGHVAQIWPQGNLLVESIEADDAHEDEE